MRSTLLLVFALTFVLQACSTTPHAASPSSPLYRITLEDAGEALLIAEALRVRPEMMEGNDFVFRATPAVHRALVSAGYAPVAVAGTLIRPRYVRVAKRGELAQLAGAGVTVVLDEREAWVVRGTPQQIARLRELGYTVSDIGQRRPRPRQIRFEARPADLEALSGTVDIHEVQRIRGAFVVIGSAFDDEIAAVRARGITVTILAEVF